MAMGDGPAPVGDRDREVTIQRVTDGIADSGMPIETWRLLSTEFMAKVDLTARERFQASQMSASADARFEMAYREDMDPDLVDVPKARRLVYRGRTYDITMARLIGRNEGIELFTLAKVG